MQRTYHREKNKPWKRSLWVVSLGSMLHSLSIVYISSSSWLPVISFMFWIVFFMLLGIETLPPPLLILIIYLYKWVICICFMYVCMYKCVYKWNANDELMIWVVKRWDFGGGFWIWSNNFYVCVCTWDRERYRETRKKREKQRERERERGGIRVVCVETLAVQGFLVFFTPSPFLLFFSFYSLNYAPLYINLLKLFYKKLMTFSGLFKIN